MDYINIPLQEHERKESTGTASSVSFMDIYLKCDTRLYGKRDNFNFAIINFPPPDINMPAALAYGVYISKLTCCSCRQSTCLHVLGSVLWCTLLFPRKAMFDSSWLPFVLKGVHIYLLAIVLSVHLQCTALITQLVSFDHCIICPSSIYRLITPLVSFGHCIVCPS
jgi:hypothetical protein